MTDQKGNALFLILVAVVLFAALSYAITQSDRGGGDASAEANLVKSTTPIQYASSIATAISRLQLRGVSVDDINFVPPYKPAFNDPQYIPGNVFHPDGGGAPFQRYDAVSAMLDTDGEPLGAWSYIELADEPLIFHLGTDTGYEIIAFLPYIHKGICMQIQKKLTGSEDIPSLGFGIDNMHDGGLLFKGAGLDRRPMVCAQTTDDPAVYVYYHAVLEQ